MVTLFNCFNYNEKWYLVEMAFDIPADSISFDEIVVPEEGVAKSDWQTVLAEQYLNADGTERICDLYEVPNDNAAASRVAFFIYKTGSHILRTPYGQFELKDEEDAPNRLKSIIEFDQE